MLPHQNAIWKTLMNGHFLQKDKKNVSVSANICLDFNTCLFGKMSIIYRELDKWNTYV